MFLKVKTTPYSSFREIRWRALSFALALFFLCALSVFSGLILGYICLSLCLYSAEVMKFLPRFILGFRFIYFLTLSYESSLPKRLFSSFSSMFFLSPLWGVVSCRLGVITFSTFNRAVELGAFRAVFVSLPARRFSHFSKWFNFIYLANFHYSVTSLLLIFLSMISLFTFIQ